MFGDQGVKHYFLSKMGLLNGYGPSQSNKLYNQGMNLWNKWTISSRKSNMPKYQKRIRLIPNNPWLIQSVSYPNPYLISNINPRSFPNHKHGFNTNFMAKNINVNWAGCYHIRIWLTRNVLFWSTERHFSYSLTCSIYFTYLKETNHMNHDDNFSKSEYYLPCITMLSIS